MSKKPAKTVARPAMTPGETRKVEVADLPSNAHAYEIADGRIYRIHMDLRTPVDQLATADYVEVETRGYQIAENGAFMVDENGEPITLPPQRARIPLGNVRQGADTVKEGWVRKALPADEVAREDVTKEARKLAKLPTTANPGDKVLVDDELYHYSEGLYESVRRARLAELPMASAVDPLDPAIIADLTP